MCVRVRAQCVYMRSCVPTFVRTLMRSDGFQLCRPAGLSLVPVTGGILQVWGYGQ